MGRGRHGVNQGVAHKSQGRPAAAVPPGELLSGYVSFNKHKNSNAATISLFHHPKVRHPIHPAPHPRQGYLPPGPLPVCCRAHAAHPHLLSLHALRVLHGRQLLRAGLQRGGDQAVGRAVQRSLLGHQASLQHNVLRGGRGEGVRVGRWGRWWWCTQCTTARWRGASGSKGQQQNKHPPGPGPEPVPPPHLLSHASA
jgi:hypothetical protein